MTALRHLCTVLMLTLALAACEGTGSGDDTTAGDTPGADVQADTSPDLAPDACCAPDDAPADLPAPDDADAVPADVPADLPPADVPVDGSTDVPFPGCCHSNADCPEGYCVAADVGAGGVCHTELLPDGSCFTDADCGGEELVCKGALLCSCDMNCVSVAGTCLPSWNDCCFTDAQCPQGSICAGEGPGGYPGACKPPAALDGQCWDDDECPVGSLCQGAAICPCDADCDMVDQPGTCQAAPGCCTSDEECDLGVDMAFVCAGVDPDSGLGVCLPAITIEGECWDDLDCPVGQSCADASFCPCGFECLAIQLPGTCVTSPTDTCCGLDCDCGEGQECVYLPEWPVGDELPGACKPIPTDGMCWTDADCQGSDQMCLGAVPCPCNLGWEGDGCDIPGQCIDKTAFGCCTADADCPEGQFCLGVTNTCAPIPEAGSCFVDAQCADGEACLGATFCPCGMMCAIGTFPGSCTALPQGCCTADADCGEGLVCRAQSGPGGLPGSCVPDPLGPQCLGDAACCWNDGDCPGASVCKNASVCGCLALCPMCGACAPDQMGYCGN